MFAKLIDMAHTPAEIKEEIAEHAGSPASSFSKYPYGLCISLDDDTLKKLGMDGDMPGVGDIIQFNAVAKVTSASENEREGTDGKTEKCSRVELQITNMGIPGVNEADRGVERSAERRKRFYGDSAKADVSDDD